MPCKPDCGHPARTIHLSGTLKGNANTERDVARGTIPEPPPQLVAQQSLFDESRAPHGQHTLWAYCHVPFGCSPSQVRPVADKIDMSERIESQIERFAPGFRDCILARHKASATDLERSNPNLAGGDISGGAVNVAQLIARPVLSPAPH